MSLQEQPQGDPNFDGGPVLFNGFTYTDGASADPMKKTTAIEYTIMWRFRNADGSQVSDVWVGATGPTDYVQVIPSHTGTTAVIPTVPSPAPPGFSDGVAMQMYVRAHLGNNTNTSPKHFSVGATEALTSVTVGSDGNGSLSGSSTSMPWDSGP